MNTKVLVTGANGQLGSTIKELYSTNQDNIQFKFATKSQLDISNKNNIKDFFSKNNFDYCINCAGYTNVEQAETDFKSAFKVNAEGVKHLAQICKATNTILIHISTDYVFDGKALKPYTETNQTKPINIYGKSKLKGEEEIIKILNQFFIIRTSWLYSEYGNNFMKKMIRLSKENNEIKVISDQIGTPTYTQDLARVILKIIKSKSYQFGIYNYSNEGITNWYDFAKTIFEFSNKEIKINPIKAEAYPTLAKRPYFSTLDKAKIKQMLNIKIPHWKNSLKTAISNL